MCLVSNEQVSASYKLKIISIKQVIIKESQDLRISQIADVISYHGLRSGMTNYIINDIIMSNNHEPSNELCSLHEK
jgi:hypothetical protein